MVQLKIDDWYNWNNGTEMIGYEFVNARRKLKKKKKIKRHHVQLEYNSTKDE